MVEGLLAKSFVSIPDSVIEKQYYLSLYGTASCSRDKEFAAPILVLGLPVSVRIGMVIII